MNNALKNEKTRILLLEDDDMIASGLIYALQNEGYEVSYASNVATAKKMVEETGFNTAVIDIQLPDGNGVEVSRLLKEQEVPVIFLTVVDDESKIVKAFEEGAEDYVVKPFRIRELMARIKRTIANNKGQEKNILTVGKVKIDTDAGKVWVEDECIVLTALEYRILLIFAANKGVLLSRNQILDRIWDIDGNFVEDNTLTVYVKRIRQKLGDAINIETVRGIGYRVD
ncbi:MAG: response regulator transcription factor [Eubacterium sp.]|nr:response regulator transcription factor [Eubacterium sp.]